MKTIIIVESPTKAKTISRFLGHNFVVDSSFGHVRDLPASSLGVDVEHNFEPKYVIPPKARPHLKKLKDLVKKSDAVILATDEDREGEAIAWHLTQALGLDEAKNAKSKVKNVERIVFHEITKKAIEDALEHPRNIDMHLVDAQQARRILDRIVGYKLSPFLWKKVARGLSAGRVQSVAVRLIAEREREIEVFRPQEYWTLTAHFDGAKQFLAHLTHVGDQKLEKLSLGSRTDVDVILQNLADASYTVQSVEKKAVRRMPPPPFTTSTLQQAASRRLGFSARQTMRVAQQLYETGFITYMRTDSLNLSSEALASAQIFIKNEWGSSYALSQPRTYKTKTKGAQEAHEAIRPTDITKTPASLSSKFDANQNKLYELIWQRFTATQMPPALFDATTIDIEAKSTNGALHTFRATGSVLQFDGFLKAYPIKTEDSLLPEVIAKEHLTLASLEPAQHFTEPPPRYSEATLIKMLEKNGIGRPSTYAPIISTIQERGYVEKRDARQLAPTEMGTMVNNILVQHFPRIVDMQFTAVMEEELDKVAEGHAAWVTVLQAFYTPFAKTLEEKYETVEKKAAEETGELCEKCGKPMVIKYGRFGKFVACSGFPECRNTKQIPDESLSLICPLCKKGAVVQRRTKRGRTFYGCSAYPECNFAVWNKPTGDMCPTCASPLVEKGKKIACSNKECPGTSSTKNS